mgnify:CR=1 FL=1
MVINNYKYSNKILKKYIYIWIFKKVKHNYKLTNSEIDYLKNMSELRSEEFRISRSCIRKALAQLFEIKPLEVPLLAPPGLPPKLENNMGYINLSHCKDALLIGWSIANIGVDIEQSNRKIKFKNSLKRIFHEKELKDIEYSSNYFSQNLIKRWVVKESLLKWQNNFQWSDCKNWYWHLGDKSARNENLDLEVKIYQRKFLNWEFSIAGQLIKEDLNIICFDNYII